MFQKGYLVWGTLVCLWLMFAQATGWQTPRPNFQPGGGWNTGTGGYGGFGSPSRGSGGFSGFGGGK